MNRKPVDRSWWKIIACMAALVGVLALWQGVGTAAPAANATGQVKQAWQKMRASASYAFAADVVIETIPLPTVGNIGRFSRSDSLYLEGTNNQRDSLLQLALWGGAVSATDPAAAYQIKVENGKAWTRAGAGEWQASDAPEIAFAPQGDFLGFLGFTKEIAYLGVDTLNRQPISKYSFVVDGPTYAEHLSQLTRARLVADGTLPPDVAMQAPEHLAQLTGQGELWVDARGLPVRQIVRLQMPPPPGADYRTETGLTVHFKNVETGRLASDWRQLSHVAGLTFALLGLPTPAETAGGLGLLSAAFLFALVVARPSRRVLVALHSAVLAAMIFGPLVQSDVAYAAAEKVAAYSAQAKQAAAQATTPNLPLNPRAAPLQPLVPLETVNLQSGGLDSDGDGLPDALEEQIGTNPFSKDTDGDGISDYDEVVGFLYNGKRWYGNPVWADSNMDGKIDGLEWNPSAPDMDGDGTPDLYDFDDDGDGVADDVDISPLSASRDNAGNLVTFSASNPLTLTVSGLQANRYTYVNVQIRPTNPAQLWYAFNVLNWPKDEKGTMQDWDQKSFFDHCIATGRTNCNMTPDANGDIKLVPMLEVAVKNLSNLPRLANGRLDTQLLQNYGITVQPDGKGGHFLYAPLNLVEDKVTGAKVAFSAQLFYQAGATWQPQQARLSWVVQVLNETYADPDAAKKVLDANNGRGNNQFTTLHAYYSDFHLTGLDVREDRGVQTAIIFEDPATDNNVEEDDALLHMMTGLDNAYLTPRDCDFVNNQGQCVGDGQRDITIPVIKQRWDRHSNSGFTEAQRWGLPADRLRVETYSYAHEDEATMIGGGTHAPALLNAHFTGTAAAKPSLLFVRESRFRAANVDSRAGATSAVTWNGQAVSVSFSGVNEVITGGYNLVPYRYQTGAGWTRQTPQEAIAEVERRYPVPETASEDEKVQAVGDQVAVVMVTSNAMQGTQSVLSQNGTTGLGASFGDVRFSGIDLRDESMRNTYVQAFSAAGRIAPFLAVSFMSNATGFTQAEWGKLVTHIFGIQMGLGTTPKGFEASHEGLANLKKSLFSKLGESAQVGNSIAKVQFFTAIGALAGVALGLVLTNLSSKAGQTAGQIILAATTAVQSTVSAVTMFQKVASNARSLGHFSEATVKNFALGFRYSLNSSYAKGAAVGAVIGILVTWSLFFAAWGKGGLSTDSIEFNTLVAGAVASTVMAVLTFLLSISFVGSVLLAFFAIFDLIALIICKAGVKAACSLGITEAITKLITQWIYTGAVMIDTKADPSITNIEDVEMRLTHPDRGLVAGNSARFEVDLWTYVRHDRPEPGIIYHWSKFFTPEDLASTTVKYSLDTTERKLQADLNQTRWSSVGAYTRISALVPSPVIGWLVPVPKSKFLYHGARSDRLTSDLYTFDTAKINTEFPLYLNTGLALPRYDCWFQICVHKSTKSTTSTNLGKSFILDILPATLDGFVAWSDLGPQNDRDGDGVPSRFDPDDTKWDTDGDGVPDGVELRNGANLNKPDTDGDGLTDAEELRYGTNPFKADTDGDGISDSDEVKGYLLTFGGRSVLVTSDPLNRDSDGDGISDGAERRLNLLDPVRYPFHPGVYNEPPVRIFTVLDDLDRVLAVGASTTVTTTVLNGTAVETALMSTGRFTVTLPSQLGGASQNSAFALLPTASRSLVLQGAAADVNGVYSITTGVAADLHAVGALQSGPFDDIIADDPIPVTIDKDQPNPPQLTLGQFVQPGRTVIIGGVASDPTSYISKVDVAVGGGSPSLAAGAAVWAFPVEIPNTPAGGLPITVRAFDAVNNTRSANFSLTIDGVSPSLTVGLNAGDRRRVQRNATGDWTLRLTGTVADALAGLASLTVQVGNSANAVVPTAAIAANGAWIFDYAFDEAAFNADPQPTGAYTLTVTARDNALPEGNPTTQVIPFVIDMTPPSVTLRSHQDDMQLTTGAVITGTVQDEHAAVAGVDFAFVEAAAVFETEETLLHLPLNDLPGTLLFNNIAMTQTRIFCLGETCPVSGVAGEDGAAVQFDGQNDMLRVFETLDLPESGLTVALWFKTNSPHAGLFSAVQGVYPAVTGYDRELFLSGGSVCSSILVGATREVRCSQATTYADNQWHQVVHTLGAGGNRLYVDGQLAVSSATTASIFTGQNRALIGYAPSAGAPFLNGALDEVVIYNAELSPASAIALYRPWRPATLSGNTWSFTVPADLEGYYQLDMRATDSVGNRGESRGDWPQFRGPVDTRYPTFDVSVTYSGGGSAAQTRYAATVRDSNLATTDYSFICPLIGADLVYATDPALLRFAGMAMPDQSKLSEIANACLQAGFGSSLVSAYACDAFGHCGAATPPQTVAYIGAQLNELNPFGRLPNAIERANLSDPRNRVRLIERPGRVIYDIEVDLAGGKLYWSEGSEGGEANAGEIWRANLDGTGQQRLLAGLAGKLPEMLQIAIDPPGNKIYWTAGYQLMWANLDGSQAAAVYSVPDDPRMVGGFREYQAVGDVVVDAANRKLYISERRNRLRLNTSIFPHSLIVEMNLNGTSPTFVAGVAAGCTYANWNSNLGMGVGAGQQPSTCLDLTGGMDVESLAVADGILYWAAYAPASVEAAVYGKAPGQPQFTVAPLTLKGNVNGLNLDPVPHLYVNPLSGGVFVQSGEQIWRGERDGQFTIFTNFRDDAPPPVGATTRRSSYLTALAIVHAPGSLHTKTDLSVEVKSRDLVLLNGGTGSYNLTLRNQSALPAVDVQLSLALPAGATFAGSSRACASNAGVVTCDFDRFAPFDTQTAVISFVVTTTEVRTLSATATVSSSTPEANPADNSATFANITATPNAAALPGLPYIYYVFDSAQLVRVPLFGDHQPEPMIFEGHPSLVYRGMSHALAGSANGASFFMFDHMINLVSFSAHGANRTVLADANPVEDEPGHGRNLAVAVHPTTGRVFYTEMASWVWSRIKSMNPDGTDVQTVNGRVLMLRGLAIDHLRGKLYWIGSDDQMRTDLIYRSNLDGSDVEVVYTPPPGRTLRDLGIDPYAQRLYWVDPGFENGSVFWADTNGRDAAMLSSYKGAGVRGLVVRPENDAIYYVSGDALYRNSLDGSAEEWLANLGARRLSRPSNLNPAELIWGNIGAADSNLAYVISTPFPLGACQTADPYEPNDTAAAATPLTAGSITAALCRSSLGATQDVDHYRMDVPPGKQLEVTLTNLPADYQLQIRQGDGVVGASINSGLANEFLAAPNYTAQTVAYTIIVFSGAIANNNNPYTLVTALTDAPQRTSFTNAECFTVDPHESSPATGNGSQGSATPLTVGQAITGALCFRYDTDFYSFGGVANQTMSINLVEPLPNHNIQVYRPNGSIFRWTGGAMKLDAAGTWAVAVTGVNDKPTMAQYGLLVRDATCGVNDPYEPNDLASQAASINGANRVFATLCSASDVDNYALTVGAGQRLTLSNPVSPAGGELKLKNAGGALLGSVLPGSRRTFTLPDAGVYRLEVANSALTGSDVAYNFLWQLDLPAPASSTEHLYFGNFPHLMRVALTPDHTAEPIIMDGGASGTSLAADLTRNKLFMADGVAALVSVDFDGRNRQVIIPNVNPLGNNVIDLPVAVDELGGRIFWPQPSGENVLVTTVDIKRSNLDGSGDPVTIKSNLQLSSMLVDQMRGELYWAAGNTIYRSDLDGNGQITVRTAVGGQQVRYMTLDPLARLLYWVDPLQNRLMRRSLVDGSETALISGLNNPHGIVLRPERNELYYSSGNAILRAALDGSNPVTIATLGRQYEGPSNLDPNSFLLTYMGPPQHNMVTGFGSPILGPCALADPYEPNNDPASATPLTVITQTVVYGALCKSVVSGPADTGDYYRVDVASGKQLAVILTELPADYRLVVIHPDNYAAVFSNNAGLADEWGSVSNLTAAPQTYVIAVLTDIPWQNTRQYKLILELADAPAPEPTPNPTDAECALVDTHDAPGVGNGTLATATALTFDAPTMAALCYGDDVDMYAFDGLAGQAMRFDLPTRPQDYDLTLYDPSGNVWASTGGVTPPLLTYGDLVTLPASGRWTVAVSQENLTPTTEQYTLLVTDESCVASDPWEPNNSEAAAGVIAAGSRVRASLCHGSDVDLYRFNAAAGQQLTLNYPANLSGANLRVYPAGGADLGQVTPGSRGVFNIGASGDYYIAVQNAGVSGRGVPYMFQLLLGSPATPPSGSPYLYSVNSSYLARADITAGSVEPILLDNGGSAWLTIAADEGRGWLYVRTTNQKIGRVNPNGTGFTAVAPNANPNNVSRQPNSLAVDTQSGRIYWAEPTFGVVGRILSANGDGSDVQQVAPEVTNEKALIVDPVGGHLYWVEDAFYQNSSEYMITRSNLDGSDERILYVAFGGRQIQDLGIDPFARKLYWIDPTQQSILWADADGGPAEVLVALDAPGRGLVVRPLENTLYFSAGDSLRRADLDGDNVQELTRQTGGYSGVSNLDPGVFFPTTLVAPASNLALAFSQPFAAPCAAVDAYEPNNTIAEAAAITPGSFTAALCTADLNNPDLADYYKLTVASGQQISVTLSNLPQDYALFLVAGDAGVDWSYNPGLADEFVSHINNSGGPVVYTIGVNRFAGMDSRQPYTLTVEVGAAPPPPPPPPPPADLCADVDPYDAPGLDGNWNRERATLIGYNDPITAALCYTADKDYYAFDGVLGQNVTIQLDPRPADYYVTLYDPDGNYATGIFPGSWLDYGGTYVLSATGRWTLVIWHPNPTPTTEQYTLELTFDSACFGLDPYEPNEEAYGQATLIMTRTLTLRNILCRAGVSDNDLDFYRFPMERGERIRITPRILSGGMEMMIGIPTGAGNSFGSTFDPIDFLANADGDFYLGFLVSGGMWFHNVDNLPYVVEIQIDPAPPAPVTPNHWSCSIYNSSGLNTAITDLATFGLPINVPVNGTVTHVGLRDLTLEHEWLGDVSFGLQAPDGTVAALFSFEDYGFYTWCGGEDCQLSLDDRAQPGLRPPQFPRGGTYLPTLGAFSVFNGKPSNGAWTLLVSDGGPSGDFGEGYQDTTGVFKGWGLEVCVDNGQTPDAPPPPPPAPAPDPEPGDTSTPGASGPLAQPPSTPLSCVAALPDAYESDDAQATASIFELATRVSSDHTFHTVTDADWMAFDAIAGLAYTFTVVAPGANDRVGLNLFAEGGATALATGVGSVSWTASAAGTYYLRATWNGGLTPPCDFAYNVAVEVVNLNATPAPEPEGPALPPGHAAPPLSAAVLTPGDGAALTGLQPVIVEVGLNAQGLFSDAELLVNGLPVDSYSAPDGVKDLVWQATWAPSQAGVYTLTAVISNGLNAMNSLNDTLQLAQVNSGETVSDSENISATSPVNVVYVDLADPSVAILAENITLATLESDGSYRLRGTAGDDSALAKVEVRLDGGLWQQALLEGSDWSLTLAPQAVTNPDGGALFIEARATDMAEREASASATVIVDVTPPDAFASVASRISSGAVITPSQLVNELNVRLSWPTVSGAVAVYAGWTEAMTPTLGSLTPYNSPDAGFHDHSMSEASVMYAHVIALDANGNQRAASSGPYYFDSPPTPDLIADLMLEQWVESGGKQVGQTRTAARGVQKLFAGWDAAGLRLRWEGFDVNSESDLYLYLGVGGGGGSTELYNPNGPGQSGVLPFAANYLVRLSPGVAPTLFTSGGGPWTPSAPAAARSIGALTDVLLPFAALGVSNPDGTSLKVLGVAAEVGTLDIWATITDQNLGRPWNQYVEFGSLGAGVIPSAGVWDDTLLETIIVAVPPSGQLVGAGDAIVVTATMKNVGNAILPGLTLNGATTGGVGLANAPQLASNIPPSGTVALTLLGSVSADGAVALLLADSYHRPYLLETLTYRVDATPPVSISLAITSVNPGENVILGSAYDESPIGSFDLEVNGSLIACTPGGVVGGYRCVWNIGGASQGSVFNLRGRAVDVYGNVGWSGFVSVVVDATPPEIAFSAAAIAALSDGRLSRKELALSGVFTDDVAAGDAQLCADASSASCVKEKVLPDNTWTLLTPALGDGVTTTLIITGSDLAGNASSPLTRSVVVDSVAPQIGVVSVNPGVILSSTAALLASGVVTDGGGVGTMQVLVLKPDWSSAIAPVIRNGGNWIAPFGFDQSGIYVALVMATDQAGNTGVKLLDPFNAEPLPPTARLTVNVVGSGVVSPTSGIYVEGAVTPIAATPNTGWSFSGWSGGLSGMDNPTVITLDNDKVVTATFTLNTYSIEVYAEPPGSGGVNGGGVYSHGASVAVTATAHSGYTFVNWSEGGVEVALNPSYTFTATANRTLTANFTPRQYGINVSAAPPAGGTVGGGGVVNHGATVTATAAANSGYTFMGWMENGNQVSANASYVFTATADRGLAALFALNQYTITVSANPPAGGAVGGGGLVSHGATVTVTATPNGDYAFINWMEGDAPVSANPSYGFTATANRSLVANFVRNPNAPATITIIKDATPKSTQNFNFGVNPPIPIVGNEGGMIGSFILDDAVPDDRDAYPKQRSFVRPGGSYNFGETPPTNWRLKAIECSTAEGSSVSVNPPVVAITLAGGDVTCTFRNELLATIQTLKYQDTNGNGVRNTNEPVLANWTITASLQPTGTALPPQVTNSLGRANFNFIPAGTYKVCEVLTSGWVNTQPGGPSPCYTLTLAPGQTASVNFGNRVRSVSSADESQELALYSPYPGVTITDADPNAIDGYAIDWAAWVDATLLTPVEEPADGPGVEPGEADLTPRIYLPVVVR